jgi:hypothetical protein
VLHSVNSFIRDASLFENDIRHIARTDVGIDGKFVPVDRAVPDFVIALTGPVVSTVVTFENSLNPRRIAGHLCRVGQLDAFLPRMEIEHDLNFFVWIYANLVQRE